MLRARIAEPQGRDSLADHGIVMRTVTLIDPLAPLFWRGHAMWPDGIGPALVAGRTSTPTLRDAVLSAVADGAISSWARLREDRCDINVLRVQEGQYRSWLRQVGPSGGVNRLIYALNPLLPCESPLVATRCVTGLGDLAVALDVSGRTLGAAQDPIDDQVVAFIAARSERRLDSEVNGLNGELDKAQLILARLRLLSGLQARYAPRPLPSLAAWVAARAEPVLETWQNRQHRADDGFLAACDRNARPLQLFQDGGQS